MSYARRSIAGLVAAALMAASGGAAVAEGRNNHYRGWDNSARHHRAAPQPQYRAQHGGYHGGHKKRDNAGKAVAIGIAAIMLGAILSQAGRDRHGSYDD